MVAGARARALEVEYCRDSSIILVDEVGKLELQKNGWAPVFDIEPNTKGVTGYY